jgi:hypothetical protein
MKKTLFLFIVFLMFFTAAMVPTGSCYVLNPYEPYNAVAAQPPTPYNLNQIVQMSRLFYEPCPWWGPYADHLPDVPPVCQPFPGPLGIPVPVP